MTGLLWGAGIYLACGLIIWLIVISHEQKSNMTSWEYIKQFFVIVFGYIFISFDTKIYRK